MTEGERTAADGIVRSAERHRRVSEDEELTAVGLFWGEVVSDRPFLVQEPFTPAAQNDSSP